MATPTGPRPKRIRPIEMAGEAPFWAVVRHLPEDEPTASRKDAQPVLLVHAATLGRRMFLVPDGGFVGYLLGQRDGDGAPRFDVFTLDWRSSNLLFGDGAQGGEGKNREDYRLDEIIDVDVVEGVKAVAKLHPGVPLHIVAHCMGAALTAQAIAEEKIGLPGATPLGHVVLATVGLCYRLGVDGWLKVSDNIMRDIEHSHPGLMGVSPHVVYDPEKLAWPPEFQKMFDVWSDSVFPHECAQPFCNRLWFLFGGDYRTADMLPMHEDSVLRQHFGAIPIGLYRHIIDNCQRGWAARWKDPLRAPARNARPFKDRAMTLITGSENQVWHRDSIDRMHEWLRRELGPGAANIQKRVFPRYGHVDLWWSKNAPTDVFPYLLDRLRPKLTP